MAKKSQTKSNKKMKKNNKLRRAALGALSAVFMISALIVALIPGQKSEAYTGAHFSDPYVDNLATSKQEILSQQAAFEQKAGCDNVDKLIPDYSSSSVPIYYSGDGYYNIAYINDSSFNLGVIVGFNNERYDAGALTIPETIGAYVRTRRQLSATEYEDKMQAVNQSGGSLWYVQNKVETTVSGNALPTYTYTMAPCYSDLEENWYNFENSLYIQNGTYTPDPTTGYITVSDAPANSISGFATASQLMLDIQYIGSKKYSANETYNSATGRYEGTPSFSDTGVFENATKISAITIGKNIRAIGNNAFIGCQFTSVSLGNNIAGIGDYAFYGCNMLSNLNLYDENADYGNTENGHAATALHQIGACAFAGTTSLRSVVMPNQVQTIGLYCFANSGMSAVNLYGLDNNGNSSLQQIGNGAFSMCKNLERVYIANGMSNIDEAEYLFFRCEALKELWLPNNTGRGDHEFSANNVTGCSALETVKCEADGLKLECGNLYKDHLEDDDYYIFGGGLYNPNGHNDKADCFGASNLGCYTSYPDQYQVLSSFAILGNRREDSYAYSYAKNHNLAFGYTENGIDYYERLSENYFYTIQKPTDGSVSAKLTKCDLYQNPGTYQYIIIPKKVGPYTVTSIGQTSFEGLEGKNLADGSGNVLENFQYVYIPDSVTSVETNTFNGCIGLNTVCFEDAMTMRDIGNRAFYTGVSEEDSMLRFIGTVSNGTQESVPYQYAMTVGNTYNNPDSTAAKYITYCTEFPTNLQIRLKTKLSEVDGTVAEAVPTLISIPTLTDGSYSLDPYLADIQNGLVQDAVNGSTTETAQNIITATKVINVPYGVRAIADEDDNGEPVFSGNTDVLTVKLNSIERVETGTFDDCTSLVNFEMGTSNNGEGEYIDGFAFENCPNLTNVTLPASLTGFGNAPFHGATALTAIEFSDSPYYVCENAIIYGLDETGNKDEIVECLRARGATGGAGTSFLGADFDGISTIDPYAFLDCTGVITADLSNSSVSVIPNNCFDGCSNLYECTLPDATRRINDCAFKDTLIRRIVIPNTYAVISDTAFVVSEAGVSGNGVTLKDVDNLIVYGYIPSSAQNYADHNPDHPTFVFEEITTLYTVDFVDGFDNSLLHTTKVASGEYIEKVTWAPPTHEGFLFAGWDPEDYYETPVTSNMTITATYESSSDANYTLTFVDDDGTVLYKQTVVRDGYATAPPITPHKNGYSFIGWDPSNYNAIPITKDMTVTAQYFYTGIFDPDDPNNPDNPNNPDDPNNPDNPGNGDSPNGSTNGNTSGTNSSGSTNGSSGTNNGGSTNGTNNSTNTTNKPNNSSKPSVSGNGTASGTGSGTVRRPIQTGGTRVDVTKTGIGNSNLVSATVTGGNGDNYVVKISDSEAARSAVYQALMNEYGSLDSIKYFAMDISLYDSTGTTKLENVSGISVNITMPIPEALVVYGGNNKAGAVSAGNTLEKLATRFTTIDGVPCMSFTATHFSPYTVYVDTNNLTASGTSDITPKTGDPIEPKWFLSIGLALLSIITFSMRGSKRRVVKVVS